MPRIGVIGGGIAGLTVALRRSRAGDEVVVFEASSHWGGQLRTELSGEFVIEHGAEGFVARSESVPALAAAVGVDDHLIDQRVTHSYAFDGSKLAPLAPGEAARMLGFQVAPDELGRGIRSFLRGMQELSDALELTVSQLCELRQDSVVQTIREGSHGLRVGFEQGREEAVDALVVATDAATAARLLEPLAGDDARALGLLQTTSSATVSLAYRREAIDHPLDGSGFIVPNASPRDPRACTFSSSKLPGRAPVGHVLLRMFFRPAAEELATTPDAEWVARAERCVGAALPVRAPPEQGWVSAWPNALPVFDGQHRRRVQVLESTLGRHRAVLAGAAFHGSGIDAAVRSAETAARALGDGSASGG
ncbi:MAG TPA: FAD-dependent oxidoreductase [Polyangiaceae bacterium]